MLSLAARLVAVLATLAAALSVASVSHAEYQPPEEITPEDGPVVPLKNAAMIVRTEGGLRYIAGQQNTRLTVTMPTYNKIRLADTGTAELRKYPGICQKKRATDGIAAVCTIPQKFIDADSMFLEIWPRLGNDVVDGRTLPDLIRMWMLMDTGSDKLLGGAGRDFANGGAGNDRARGGDGDDRLRLGVGNDQLWGDAGNDYLVATHDDDVIHGGIGDDLMYGGNDNDVLYGDAGTDLVSCGDQWDVAYVDGSDDARNCEDERPPGAVAGP